MKEYQDRVTKEVLELRTKITKLGIFIVDNPAYSELDHKQKELLQRQRTIMLEYASILDERIKLF